MNNRLQSRDEGRDFDRSKVATMIGSRKCSVAVYVDRPSQQWVVRDPHGDFWLLPPVEDCWEQRRPFHLTDESDTCSTCPSSSCGSSPDRWSRRQPVFQPTG